MKNPEFKYELGATVKTVGGVAGAAITARGSWQHIADSEPKVFYDVRLGDKTFMVSEAEIESAS